MIVSQDSAGAPGPTFSCCLFLKIALRKDKEGTYRAPKPDGRVQCGIGECTHTYGVKQVFARAPKRSDSNKRARITQTRASPRII